MENITSRMKIGMMDEEIQVQRFTIGVDGYGEEVKTWETLYCLLARAEYATTGNNEIIETGLETTLRRISFTIRYEEDLKETDRILYDDDLYDIIAIQKIGRRMYTKIATVMRKP